MKTKTHLPETLLRGAACRPSSRTARRTVPSTPQIAVNVRVGVTTLSCSSFHVTPDADTMKMYAASPMRVAVATARRSKGASSANHYELTSKSQFWTRNMRNWTKSLVSGIWFLSPEAGGTLRRQLGEPGRAVHSTSPLRCCIRTL